MIPFLIAYMIDTQIPALNPGDSLLSIYLNGGLMVLIALLGWILNVTANRSSEYIASRAVETLRSDLFLAIENLSSQDIDTFSKPSLISSYLQLYHLIQFSYIMVNIIKHTLIC
jgi:ABC-type multidrug transport system fused ATPase/permease subunit